MRTIKIEALISVPDDYKIDKTKLELVQVLDLLDVIEDRYSNVYVVDGKIIGESNDETKRATYGGE